tara:strand:- start:214 stop:465 length:252 start_codon:yes stop_codon:yes gene_type:complete
LPILFVVNALPVTETTFSVGDLQENEAGLGQPNEASAKIVAKHPYGRFLESTFGCATLSPFVYSVFQNDSCTKIVVFSNKECL